MDALEEGGWGWGWGTGRKGDGGNGSQKEACPSAWLTWLPDKWRLEELVEEVRLRDRLDRWKTPPHPTPHMLDAVTISVLSCRPFVPLSPAPRLTCWCRRMNHRFARCRSG